MRVVTKSFMASAAFAALAALAPMKAYANVTWTLEGVTFDDGGTASGTFVTNDLGRLQTFDIVTTAGSTLGAETYDSNNGGAITQIHTSGFRVNSDDGATNLFLEDVGTDLLVGNSPITFQTGSLEVNNSTFVQRNLTAGGAVVDAPEPMSIALLGTGLAGILLARRRA